MDQVMEHLIWCRWSGLARWYDPWCRWSGLARWYDPTRITRRPTWKTVMGIIIYDLIFQVYLYFYWYFIWFPFIGLFCLLILVVLGSIYRGFAVIVKGGWFVLINELVFLEPSGSSFSLWLSLVFESFDC